MIFLSEIDMNFGLDSEMKTEVEDDLLNTEVKLEEEEAEEINPLQDCNDLKVELKGRNNQNIYLYHLKVTGHSKIEFFCRVSPISTRLFCYTTFTFKRTSLWLFRSKISQLVPFWIKNPQNLSEICKKGTNCEILNLNNWRLGRLKVHVME